MFIYPLTSLINLFIHVLQHPTLASVESDIDLMYVVSGHFSYLEFACFEMAFPFTRQIANLARRAVTTAKAQKRKNAEVAKDGGAVVTNPCVDVQELDFGTMDDVCCQITSYNLHLFLS